MAKARKHKHRRQPIGRGTARLETVQHTLWVPEWQNARKAKSVRLAAHHHSLAQWRVSFSLSDGVRGSKQPDSHRREHTLPKLTGAKRNLEVRQGSWLIRRLGEQRPCACWESPMASRTSCRGKAGIGNGGVKGGDAGTLQLCGGAEAGFGRMGNTGWYERVRNGVVCAFLARLARLPRN